MLVIIGVCIKSVSNNVTYIDHRSCDNSAKFVNVQESVFFLDDYTEVYCQYDCYQLRELKTVSNHRILFKLNVVAEHYGRSSNA
jgi:hypothetical protein